MDSATSDLSNVAFESIHASQDHRVHLQRLSIGVPDHPLRWWIECQSQDVTNAPAFWANLVCKPRTEAMRYRNVKKTSFEAPMAIKTNRR